MDRAGEKTHQFGQSIKLLYGPHEQFRVTCIESVDDGDEELVFPSGREAIVRVGVAL